MSGNKIYITVLWIVNLTLFSALIILILGMLNGSIEYKYSAELISAIGTFGGALAGAILAGYISAELFNKNIKHEEEKRSKEQDIRKLILLNDYIKESKNIMSFISYLETDIINEIKEIEFPTPWKHDTEKEKEVYNTSFEYFLRKSDQLIREIEVINLNLNNLNFEAILDVDFRDDIRNHRFLLVETKCMTEEIKEKATLKNYNEIFEYKDIIANFQRYLRGYRRFEKHLYNLKQ